MRFWRNNQRKRRFLGLAIATFVLVVFSVIPIRLAIAFHQAPLPQAIFTLGGGFEREQFTAQFAQHHQTLPVWISSGTRPDNTRGIFQAYGIPNAQLRIDCRATDTVTNFTTMVEEFKRHHIQHLYLITADFHMSRAKAIATLILGSNGIAFTPIAAPIPPPPSDYHSPESWISTLRDGGRAMFWILTGRSGASLNPKKVTPCL